jgi:hypothetical protein
LALDHIIHASHKTCNFRFIESKGRGEKSKQKIKGETCREQRERE